MNDEQEDFLKLYQEKLAPLAKHWEEQHMEYIEKNKKDGYWVDGILCMNKEDIDDLRVIFPDMPLDEMYAVHYIHSRQGNCSWMCIPKTEYGMKGIEDYRKEYKERIKPHLTQEIIDAINHYDCVGSDSVEYKGIGYNLDKIFHYFEFYGYDECGGEGKPETYIVEEKPEVNFNDIVNFITASYENSILSYLCGGENESK